MYLQYIAQKVMMYILLFSENNKHKFRRLYCYTFIHRLLWTHVCDIFLCRHTVHANIVTWVSVRTVKCHPKCNLVEGVLSQGVGCRTPDFYQRVSSRGRVRAGPSFQLGTLSASQSFFQHPAKKLATYQPAKPRVLR